LFLFLSSVLLFFFFFSFPSLSSLPPSVVPSSKRKIKISGKDPERRERRGEKTKIVRDGRRERD
jgi:hypothetical protein